MMRQTGPSFPPFKFSFSVAYTFFTCKKYIPIVIYFLCRLAIVDYLSFEEATKIAREVAWLKKLKDSWPPRKTGFGKNKGCLKGGMPPKRSLRLRTDEEIAKEAAITPGKRDRSSSESSTSLWLSFQETTCCQEAYG